MASTITTASVVTLASIYTELIPLTGIGGNTNQPALTIVQDTLARLLARPFGWKFNRGTAVSFFVTQQNRQDYLHAGATAWTQNGGVGIGLASSNAITESGYVVTVNTLQPHNFNVGDTVYMNGNTVAAYNSVLTQNGSSTVWSGGWVITAVTSTSFTFTHATSGLANSGAAGITDFGWIESGTFLNMNDQAAKPYEWYLTGVRDLQPSSRVTIPTKIAMENDNNAGVLTFRFDQLPGAQPFGVTPVYQKLAPVPSDLTGTWSPFPDQMAYVYRQMFKAVAYEFAKSPIAVEEFQKAEAFIQGALIQDDREQSEEYIAPEAGLMNSQSFGGWWF